jgi:hypothetical protein
VITQTLNLTGALLVNYIGHGNIDRWASEQILVNSDIASLTNGAKLPVVLSMTCLDGYWIYPGRQSLVEELVRAEGKGAIAAFSPTGLGMASGHDQLQRGFYDALASDQRVLGQASAAGKLRLYTAGYSLDLLHTFTIFGDPALHLHKPGYRRYLPLAYR